VHVEDGLAPIDGRDVGFRVYGPGTGAPVVLHNGTAGTSLLSLQYGVSTRQPGSHGEYLARVIPNSRQAVLSGGHILNDDDLDSIYAWLAS